MTEQPTLIKRPVIEVGDKIIIGFSEAEYQQTFQS
jgi:arsenate reductase-like glutaredoxin family protein